MEVSLQERSDLTTLTNTLTALTSGANTVLALLPLILLFKGAFILGNFSSSSSSPSLFTSSLGLVVKDKVGHLLPSRIYTETLPYSSSNSNIYNSRDHNSLHDLVPPRTLNNNQNYESVVSSPSSFSSYPRHKRRLSALTGTGLGSSHVSDMVAVAAGAQPYTLEKLDSRDDQPKTYQSLIKQSAMDQPREDAPSFWESFVNIRRWKNSE